MKRTTRLTPSNIDYLIRKYQTRLEDYPQIMKDIMEKLVNEMLDDVYPDSEIIPITQNKGKTISGIRNTQPKWTYHEYGTGIIGSQFPHVDEVLKKAGWKYDVNQHGEKGWWYPTDENDPNPYKWETEEGELRAWTKGLVAERCFYDALQRAKERLPDIAEEVFKNYDRGAE